ncbi:MAG: HPr family phosphocarrier protein [Candidatus Electryoneaceae bacterium]|nr:HPr family phosphocarrier protein [Candidatus Electryoneaceae bacterium]
MVQAIVTITNRLGLHARPATKIVSIASRTKADVFLSSDERRVNAKSVLGVIMLEAIQGSHLTIEVDGDGKTSSEEEKSVLDEIVELVRNNFKEKNR